MTRARWTAAFSRITFAFALGAAVIGTSACLVPEVEYSSGGDYPPDTFIATADPFYYDGYACYWYNGAWFFRDHGGRWGHYNREPSGLRQHRAQGAPARHVYESGSRSVSRGGSRSGGRSAGGHSGGRGGRR